MKIVFTPDWFLGSDVLIEIFSFIILFAFFYLSVKNYKLSKNKNSLYLGIGFLLIALAEIATILTKFVLYFDTSFTQEIGRAIITYQVVNSIDIFYYIGFFFHKLLTLLGFYVIYRLPLKRKSSGDVLIGLTFIIIAALFSQGIYYLFHLAAVVLLILITRNYYEIYKKNKSGNTIMLIIAFSILAFSQAIFLLSTLKVLYALAQSIQVVSYLILLILIIRIIRVSKEGLKDERKKKSSRHNIRHVGDYSRKKRKN